MWYFYTDDTYLHTADVGNRMNEYAYDMATKKELFAFSLCNHLAVNFSLSRILLQEKGPDFRRHASE